MRPGPARHLTLVGADSGEPAEWDADAAVTHLFRAHYRILVRLGAMLCGDPARAEELAQDAYVQLHARWGRLRDTDKALAYLRQSVVNRSRSTLRRRLVADRYLAAQPPPPTIASAEHLALDSLAQARMLADLRTLPARQREALVLRYYLDLSEADVADAMGVSRGAVKSHTSRGLAALRQSEQWASREES
ncbi:SigE family RNA polymerase sigma factor [Catellatospora tritici]|uniref:SigE family RNA polymerase sigma factor n=1 Tax=Catellatospora tritici TaxID=2851566 RepID=UPI001C2CF648|nr:SigE family RNA polymerase sigma factor [Catellatospora tritici]MBV1855977.1 SigE family RNA polymerase sigma factor [Catellatospora tritici]